MPINEYNVNSAFSTTHRGTFTYSEISPVELISTLLGKIKNRSTRDFANLILEDNNNSLLELSKRSLQSLQTRYDLPPKKALALFTALEMARRYTFQYHSQLQTIDTLEAAYFLMAKQLAFLQYEEAWIVYLDANLKLLKKLCLGTGDVNSVKMEALLIVNKALEFNATHMILYHNHPSGNCIPSSEDIECTAHLVACMKYYNLTIIDDIIIGRNECYSFRKAGILNS